MQSNVTNTRKRNKHFVDYHKNHKKCKLFTIEPGMTGFLCTCNFHEKGCITDAYKLLNQFADEGATSETIKVLMVKEYQFRKYTQNNINFCLSFYFKEPEVSNISSTHNKKEADKSTSDLDEEEDISTTLVKEIDELRAKCEMPLSSRRFQVAVYNY